MTRAHMNNTGPFANHALFPETYARIETKGGETIRIRGSYLDEVPYRPVPRSRVTLFTELVTEGPSISGIVEVRRQNRRIVEQSRLLYKSNSPEAQAYLKGLEPEFAEAVQQFINSPLWDLTICLGAVNILASASRETEARDILHSQKCLDRHWSPEMSAMLLGHPMKAIRIGILKYLASRQNRLGPGR